MKTWIALGVWGWASLALGFPEMIRHGYQRCDTCHASPDGGGVLTAYGRALSNEVLSTWGTEKEAALAYGAITLPEWASLGGDVRFAQTHLDTPTFRAGRSILMQADVEGAATFAEKWTAVLALGYQNEFLSRRHYLLYRASDHWVFRAGRFLKAYGVRMPDHIVEIRRGLGWDEGAETYNVEGSYFGENFQGTLTASLGRPDRKSVDEETSLTWRGGWGLGDRHRLGFSYHFGSKGADATRSAAPAGVTRHVGGPFALLGLGARAFILGEVDVQVSQPKGRAESTAVATYLKLGVEPWKGVVPYLTHEISRTDLKRSATQKNLYTVGLQWFPRPHFEFLGSYQKQAGASDGDYLWLMAHYYF